VNKQIIFIALIALFNNILISNNVFAQADTHRAYCKDGKWGFIDIDGNPVVQCIYDDADRYYYWGRAAVKNEGKWSIIDERGKELIPFKYDNIFHFQSKMARVELDGKYGYIDLDGKEVVPCEYQYARDFSYFRAAVMKDGKWGFVDNYGNKITEIKYDNVYSFVNSIALVCKQGKWGYINTKGEEFISCRFDKAQEFMGETAIVELDGKTGKIDKNGTFLIKPDYEHFTDFDHNGYAGVKNNGKWGLINRDGKQVLPCKYDDYFIYYSGDIWVMLDDKWGLADSLGNEITEIKYDAPSYFGNNKTTQVVSGGKKGIISKKGEILPADYDDIRSFPGYYILISDGKAGLADMSGNILLPCKFKSINSTHNDNLAVNKGDTCLIVSQDGSWNPDWDIDDYYGLYSLKKQEIIVPPFQVDIKCTGAGIFVKDIEKWGLYRGGRTEYIYDYVNEEYGQNGLYILDMGEQGYTVFDSIGNMVIPIAYDEITFYNDRSLIVKQKDKYGFVNTDRRITTRIEATEIRKEFYSVDKQDNMELYYATAINEEGKIAVVSPDCEITGYIYDEVIPDKWHNDHLAVKRSELWGFVRISEARETINCEYLSVQRFHNHYIANGLFSLVSKGSGSYLIDTLGRRFYEESYIYKKNGLYGIAAEMDEEPADVLPAKYKKLYRVSTDNDLEYDLYIAKQDGKYGVVNSSDDILIPFKYNKIVPIETYSEAGALYLLVKENKKFGLYNHNAELIIPVENDDLTIDNYFIEYEIDIFIANQNKRYGIYNRFGKQLIPFEYDDFKLCELDGFVDNKNDFGILAKNNNIFALYSLDGTELLPCEYDFNKKKYYEYNLTAFGEIIKNGKYGFIDDEFNIFIPCTYENAKYFSYGIAAVMKGDKWGYINKNNEMIISPKYEDAGNFKKNGYASVKYNKKWGIINSCGEEKGEFIYDDEIFFKKDDHAVVKKRKKFGCIDTNGIEFIRCRFDYMSVFNNGFAQAKIKDSYGFINRDDSVVVDFNYDDVSDFQSVFIITDVETGEGELVFLARVKMNDKLGVINEKGKRVTDIVYDHIYEFTDDEEYYSNGYARVSRDDKYGMIDHTGKLVIPCKYDWLEKLREGKVKFKLDKKEGEVDLEGNEMFY